MRNKGLVFVVTALISILTVIPFIWIVVASLRTRSILTGGFSLSAIKLDNYKYVLFESNLPRSFLNSLITCGFATLLNIALASLAAYAFSRYEFRGKKILFFSVIVTQLLPAAAIVVPLYQIWTSVGLFNSRLGLGVAYSGFTVAVSLLLLKGFFDNVPKEIDESAKMDGCGEFRNFIYIILPLTVPALTASAIFTFLTTWQEFLFASTLMNSPSYFTMPVALYSFIGAQSINWGAIMAGSVLTALPALIIFSVLQKYFVQTITGSIKG